tara:strand:+ start:873 stop:1058 length:186 start_codon:yes stop_codon:yes gene_type:complete
MLSQLHAAWGFLGVSHNSGIDASIDGHRGDHESWNWFGVTNNPSPHNRALIVWLLDIHPKT